MATVLIIDDNPINVRLLSVALRAAGFTVRTAGDAVAARTLVAGCDVVLMDILMPDVDGLELTRELKRDPVTQSIPVIAVTGYPTDFKEDEAIRAGCVSYVTKPIDTRTLPELLHATIALSRGSRRSGGRRREDIQQVWRDERRRVRRETWKRRARMLLRVLPAVLAAVGAAVAAVRAWWK